MSEASTRAAVSPSGSVSMPWTGRALASRRALASGTGKSAMAKSPRALRFIMAGLAASLFEQPYATDFHRLVGSLGHVVDGQAGDGDGGQRFHLHAGLAGELCGRG